MWHLSFIICVVSFVTIQGKAFKNDCHDMSEITYSEKFIMELKNASVIQIAISKTTGYKYVAVFDRIADQNKLFSVHEQEELYEISWNNSYIITSIVTIDTSENKVYIGTDEGLMVYDEVTGTIENIPEIEQNIWNIFVAKGSSEMFMTLWPNGEIYKYSYPRFEEENLHINVSMTPGGIFVTDLEGNCYYDDDDGTRTQLLSEANSESFIIKGGIFDNLAVDNNGRVYGTAHNRLYRLKANNTPELVSLLGLDIHYMTFDENNNVIFGIDDEEVSVFKYDNKCISPSNSQLLDSINEMTIKINLLSNRTDELYQELVESRLAQKVK